jgi:hypothetical protein
MLMRRQRSSVCLCLLQVGVDSVRWMVASVVAQRQPPHARSSDLRSLISVCSSSRLLCSSSPCPALSPPPANPKNSNRNAALLGVGLVGLYTALWNYSEANTVSALACRMRRARSGERDWLEPEQVRSCMLILLSCCRVSPDGLQSRRQQRHLLSEPLANTRSGVCDRAGGAPQGGTVS